MSRSRDIAAFLGKTEITNTSNNALLNTASPTGLDSAQVSSIASASGIQVYATPDLLPTSGLTAGDQAFVTSNSRIYISNGSGWYNVALINSTPTFTSGPAGSYTLATDLTPTVITLVAQDSDGQVVTYSAAADSNMTPLATLSQDSSVFTVTPLHDSAGGGTGSFNITFQATDGIGIASGVSTFSLTFGPPVYDVDLSTGYRLGGYITNAEIDTWGAGTGANEFVGGLGLSSNGNHLFVGVDRQTAAGVNLEPMITRYDMSTPYDYTSKTLNTGQTVTSWGGSETNFRGMHVSHDGYHIFLAMGGDGLQHYTMSTAWDLTSRSLTQKYHDDGVVCKVGGYIAGFHMNHDGTKAYTAGNTNQGYITYLTLSTPWDLTTATSATYSIPSPFTSNYTIRDIWLNNDGTQLVMCNANYGQTPTQNLASWDLTTPWNISTATNPVTWPASQSTTVIGEFEIWPTGGAGQGGNDGIIMWSPYTTNLTYQVDIGTVGIT